MRVLVDAALGNLANVGLVGGVSAENPFGRDTLAATGVFRAYDWSGIEPRGMNGPTMESPLGAA